MSEFILAAAIIGILFAISSFEALLMPMTTMAFIMVAFGILILFYLGLFWKEKGDDEREDQHIFRAGRIAYILGTLTIVTGIIVQALRHNIDPWLVYVLVVMILSKLLAHLYQRWKM